MPKQVTLYTSPSCGHCRRANAFLLREGIRFRELDITRSTKARKALERIGARGVPVVLIGDRRLEGFDERAFLALLHGER